jgi:hypothetical protein
VVPKPATLNLYTSPNLYVGKVSCDAKLCGPNGEIQDFGADTAQAVDYWSGFHSSAATARESYQASAFRIWEPQETDYPEADIPASDLLMQPSRLLTLCPSASKIIAIGPQAFSTKMTYGANMMLTTANEGRSDISGELVDNRLIFLDRPLFVPDSNNDLKTTLDFVLAYGWKDAGELERTLFTSAISGGTGTQTLYVDWITVAQSNIANSPIDSADAEDQLDEYGAAIVTAYSSVPQYVRLPAIVNFAPTGQVGAVRLIAAMYPSRNSETAIAFNYSPQSGLAL